MTTYNVKEKTNFTIFDSPEEYLHYINNVDSKYVWSPDLKYLGRNLPEAKKALAEGDTTYLAQAQVIIDKMVDAQIFSTGKLELRNDMVGFLPNVPAALAGQPMDMYNIKETEDQNITTPLNIYIETLVSQGVSHDKLIARGVAVLAFCLAMNNIRPVELYTICIGKPSNSQNKSGGIVCRVPSKPIDLERATFMLCDPAYYRQLAFIAMGDHVKSNDTYVQWPWNNDPTNRTHEPMMRELLDMQPEDVFMPGGYLFDQLMLNNPVQWVRNMIQKHNGQPTGE
jgi:hypothetical protein